MKVTDEILNEWSFRCHDGVVDLNDPKKLLILKEILDENGITLEEEETPETETTIEPTTTNADVEELQSIFKNISSDYGKYLSIFNSFDPNSLGTISEVLMTKLITNKGYKALHTGGSQELTDIIVNGHRISLKTTVSDQKIGLGSSTEKANAADSKRIAKIIDDLTKKDPNVASLTVGELKNVLSEDDWNKINGRLEAIARKLAGTGNDEFFVWVEKVINKKNKMIESLVIHTIKYDYQVTMKTFYNGILSTTGASGWGVKHKEGNIMIQADAGNKLLNVTPSFVKICSSKSQLSIPLIKNLQVANLTDLITDKLFKALDTIYSDIFPSETTTD